MALILSTLISWSGRYLETRGTNWFPLNYILSAWAHLSHTYPLPSLIILVLWRPSQLSKNKTKQQQSNNNKSITFLQAAKKHHLHEAGQEGIFAWPQNISSCNTFSKKIGNASWGKSMTCKSVQPGDNDTSWQDYWQDWCVCAQCKAGTQ